MVVCQPEKGRKKTVTDAEFAAAMANVDNSSVVKAVLRQYASVLDKDERESCGLKAMWRTLQNHSDEFGQKFTTSLHRFAHWECRRELRRRSPRSQGGVRLLPLFEDCQRINRSFQREDIQTVGGETELMEHLRIRLESLPDESQRTLVRQYYLDGMTMDEVGAANGFSREVARQRLARAIADLRAAYLEGLE